MHLQPTRAIWPPKCFRCACRRCCCCVPQVLEAVLSLRDLPGSPPPPAPTPPIPAAEPGSLRSSPPPAFPASHRPSSPLGSWAQDRRSSSEWGTTGWPPGTAAPALSNASSQRRLRSARTSADQLIAPSTRSQAAGAEVSRQAGDLAVHSSGASDRGLPGPRPAPGAVRQAGAGAEAEAGPGAEGGAEALPQELLRVRLLRTELHATITASAAAEVRPSARAAHGSNADCKQRLCDTSSVSGGCLTLGVVARCCHLGMQAYFDTAYPLIL